VTARLRPVHRGSDRPYCRDTRAKIPQQWQRLAPSLGKVPGQVGDDAYGVCPASDPDCPFEYLAGVAVSSPDRLSVGFTTVKVDARSYTVFTRAGNVSSLLAAIDTIWTKWAPDCGLHIASGAPYLRCYTHEFDPGSGLGGTEVGSIQGRRPGCCAFGPTTLSDTPTRARRLADASADVAEAAQRPWSSV
jgi:AraC family transcriptional regulator